MNINKQAEEYATRFIPNPDKYDAPYCTTLDRWRDMRDAFLAGCAAASRWIPIEEGLPDRTEFVQMYTEDCNVYYGYCPSAPFLFGFKITHYRYINTEPPK